MKKRKLDIAEGDKVYFHSGNFEGLSGVVTKIDIQDSSAPYGFVHEVKLSNGQIGFIEKSEHWVFEEKQ